MELHQEANQRIDAILESLPVADLERESRQVAEEFIRTGCTISGKPIPTFLKVCLIDKKQEDRVRHVTEVVMNCLEKVSDLYYTHPEMKPMFELLPGEGELTDVRPGFRRKMQHVRLDAFLAGDDLQFCEFNCDTPGGPGYMDYLTDILLETSAMKQLKNEYVMYKDRFMEGVLQALLDCYAEWKGTRVDRPPFLITTHFALDPTLSEIESMTRWFQEKGFDCVLADAKDVRFDGKYLVAEGRQFDLMYRRGAGYWWLDKKDDYAEIIRAYQAGAICTVNPISSKLGGKKSLMAVLQSDMMQDKLSEEERQIVHGSIPWTRMMREGKTVYRGEQVDLVSFVRARRETMVLKPIGLFGGKDVTVGHTVSQAEWEGIVDKALRESYVVQEKIEIPEVTMPVVQDGRLVFQPKKVNLNFFAFNGKYGGGMARVSDSWIINVSAGGGLVPMLTVHGKK